MATPQAAGNKNAPKTGAPQAAKEPKVKRFSKKAKFVAGAATLTVTIRQGKSGDFNVASLLKQPNEKAKTGEKSTHKDQTAGMAAYEKSVAKATSKGWQARSTVTRQSFDEIPDAAAFLAAAKAPAA